MAKYIFVTGGVVSSLGKGITAASIGCLLKNCGLKVNILKIDPYINVDPGTMSPFQHGEVYVTDDGAETDLDLGYYERFMDVSLTQDNNFTTGRIYDTIISRERRGDFLGGTVQVIPHVTNEIISRIRKLGSNCDVVITEIGGTTGDIEGLPFLEAIRQFRLDLGRENACYVHVTLVPYIRAADEMKTKPTQQSVAKLREIGIEPQILICRTEKTLPESMKKKIALFCNVQEKAVIEEKDVSFSIYEVPVMLKKQGMDRLILEMLNLKTRPSKMSGWEKMLDKMKRSRKKVTIAVAGKYTNLRDAYKSIWEALLHAGTANSASIQVKYVDVETRNLKKELKGADGILVPGGFGDRGIEGKIEVVRFARENKIPFLGLCLGMQCAVIEFARNVCGLKGANSTEFNPKTPFPVIDMMLEQKKLAQKGGTMRLGEYPCEIKKNSLALRAYKKNLVFERHRHRYELNNEFRELLELKGLKITGECRGRKLVEIVEIEKHPWFVAVQFHPEFKSRPNRPHPLFTDFIKSAVKR
ncbi:CTP synthase [Candidatus Desantisbacteria bacterium CG_4_10_14_0_8_um_filter_48_22]|uniref:CTP synthase n=1 Tax=Candidatus Desantisbacteria bacterium CG_4_10_14_0_8_um_filter_48_22 TaxID=1974543 RepID=A0A2M7S5B7_9BACT|nr:MAG: CTP synthase [Candidatus Desantisbacteria bacterium CG1_02_49_89]PIV54185.1 MAG: CTP synthase [Candidatus Desantisbacteria bacterium CG02_land_8_20_14_3_00_49_13]PIZ14724.1 MAG: CTP synthase [Candidatus Desantisbacteria bacterium CG_4_10_14_0_8_um_filter_48_22]PJB28643.1 MAG: CTP synthase [Candidatus Desantisbacteria bacterium CG_4_9_14_3_um_filter_50_7]